MIAQIGGKFYQVRILEAQKDVTKQLYDSKSAEMENVVKKVCEFLVRKNVFPTARRASVQLGLNSNHPAVLSYYNGKTAIVPMTSDAETEDLIAAYGAVIKNPMPKLTPSSQTSITIDEYLHDVPHDGNCGSHAICHGLSKRYESDTPYQNLLTDLTEKYFNLAKVQQLPKEITQRFDLIDKNKKLEKACAEKCQILLRYLAAKELELRAQECERHKKHQIPRAGIIGETILSLLSDDRAFRLPGKNKEVNQIRTILSRPGNERISGNDAAKILRYRAKYWTSLGLDSRDVNHKYLSDDFFKRCSVALAGLKGIQHIAMVESDANGRRNYHFYSSNRSGEPTSKNTIFIYHTGEAGASGRAVGMHYQSFQNNPVTEGFLQDCIKEYRDQLIAAFLSNIYQAKPGTDFVEGTPNPQGVINSLGNLKKWCPSAFYAIQKIVGRPLADKKTGKILVQPTTKTSESDSIMDRLCDLYIRKELSLEAINMEIAVGKKGLFDDDNDEE